MIRRRPGQPSARETLLGLFRVAGYHDDHATFTRLYVERRISIAAARKAFRQGMRAKANGVRCACFECSPRKDPKT